MKKSLVIVSVCLVLLMSLSIISAGWFTGYAISKDIKNWDQEEKFMQSTTYGMEDSSIEIRVFYVNKNGEAKIRMRDGGLRQEERVKKGTPKVFDKFGITIEVTDFNKIWGSDEIFLRVSEAVDELSSEDEETLKGFFNYGVDHKLDLDLANPNQNCDVCREYTSESDKEYNLYTTKNVGSNWICYSELSSHRPQEGGMRPGLQDYVAWTEVKFIGAGLPGELSGEFESEIQGKTNNAKCVYVASHPITNKPEFVLLSYRKFSLLLKEGKIIKEKSEDEFNTFKVKYGRRLNINGETNYYKLT
jgi:hypothetical protein